MAPRRFQTLNGASTITPTGALFDSPPSRAAIATLLDFAWGGGESESCRSATPGSCGSAATGADARERPFADPSEASRLVGVTRFGPGGTVPGPGGLPNRPVDGNPGTPSSENSPDATRVG